MILVPPGYELLFLVENDLENDEGYDAEEIDEMMLEIPALDEQRMREKGFTYLRDADGVIFGGAHWLAGAKGLRWYACSTRGVPVRVIGKTVAAVTRQLARKLETR